MKEFLREFLRNLFLLGYALIGVALVGALIIGGIIVAQIMPGPALIRVVVGAAIVVLEVALILTIIDTI